MATNTPEAERDELQQRLREELGVYAPTLGTPPERVRNNAIWVWLGLLIFASLTGGLESGGPFSFQATLIVTLGAAACWGGSWLYERSYWAKVEAARAAHKEAQGGRSEAAGDQ